MASAEIKLAVANPTAISLPCSNPNSWNTRDSPATVPCPPSKLISSSEALTGGNPNTGTAIAKVTMPPIIYCPQAIVCPNATCGAASLPISVNFSSGLPKNNVANTTLINSGGMRDHTVYTSGGSDSIGIYFPAISGPSNNSSSPDATAVGKNSFRSNGNRTTMKPTKSATTSNATPIANTCIIGSSIAQHAAKIAKTSLIKNPSIAWRDTNLLGWAGGIRTPECQDQNLVPYHLATAHY